MANVINITQLGKRYDIRSQRDYSLRSTLQRALKFRFGKKAPFWALRDINLAIDEGEVFGIIGTNGSGKSTFLKILSKIVVPTTGRVELTGKVNSLLEVGTGFHPELTGRENVYLNGSILGLRKSEIKARFDQIVDFSEVELFLDTPVKHYSSGMYVRLAFAVAVHLNPDILIIDEVLSVGDLAFQQKCITKMEEEVLKGRTVLLVSHNMEIVSRLCDRVMLLHQGKNLEIGEPKAVIEHYYHNMKSKARLTFDNPEQRQGSGAIRFEGMHVMDVGRNDTKVLSVGSGMIIKLSYVARKNHFDDIEIRVILKTVGGQIITALSSAIQETKWETPLDRGAAECHIQRLPLNIGEYNIDIELYCDQQLSDCLRDIYPLEIVAGPYYLSGNLPGSRYPVLFDCTWH